MVGKLAQKCSDIIIYINGHGSEESVTVGQRTIPQKENGKLKGYREEDAEVKPQDINSIVKNEQQARNNPKNPKKLHTTFKLVVDSCHSGVWTTQTSGLLVSAAATGQGGAFDWTTGSNTGGLSSYTEAFLENAAKLEDEAEADTSGADKAARLIELAGGVTDHFDAYSTLGLTKSSEKSNLPPPTYPSHPPAKPPATPSGTPPAAPPTTTPTLKPILDGSGTFEPYIKALGSVVLSATSVLLYGTEGSGAPEIVAVDPQSGAAQALALPSALPATGTTFGGAASLGAETLFALDNGPNTYVIVFDDATMEFISSGGLAPNGVDEIPGMNTLAVAPSATDWNLGGSTAANITIIPFSLSGGAGSVQTYPQKYSQKLYSPKFLFGFDIPQTNALSFVGSAITVSGSSTTPEIGYTSLELNTGAVTSLLAPTSATPAAGTGGSAFSALVANGPASLFAANTPTELQGSIVPGQLSGFTFNVNGIATLAPPGVAPFALLSTENSMGTGTLFLGEPSVLSWSPSSGFSTSVSLPNPAGSTQQWIVGPIAVTGTNTATIFGSAYSGLGSVYWNVEGD